MNGADETASNGADAMAGSPQLDLPEELKRSITPDEMADLLRQAGYRATIETQNGVTRVQSAAQGLGFFVSFGNADAGDARRHVDFTFHCPLTLRGELPAETVSSWNDGKRFARLSRNDTLLVLAMDVLVAGGVSLLHLRAQCELWDHLIQQLILHLKQPPSAAAMAG